ncbi:MAG TPA: TetR/AcrR family transcriptional regulator [Acetobacteraceae bacterium]|nr:TetR/AcrR family transcriptional regulator [Acetobacteraceae bacterium]
MAAGAVAEALAPRVVPRQRRAIERRRAILNATLALLEDHGVDGITTSLIAARAGVPVASVYGYFPNKMAVIAALMHDAMAEVDGRMERLLAAATDAEGVARAIDLAIDTVIEGYRAMPARQRLFSAVRGNEALDPVARASDARMTTALMSSMLAVRPEIRRVRARAVAQTVVQTFTALQEGVLTCTDPELIIALVAEWRALIKSYLLPLTSGLTEAASFSEDKEEKRIMLSPIGA